MWCSSAVLALEAPYRRKIGRNKEKRGKKEVLRRTGVPGIGNSCYYKTKGVSAMINMKRVILQCLVLTTTLLLWMQAASATTVRVTTSLGEFSIELFDDVTPDTVANFLKYVNSGRYNDSVIHRVQEGSRVLGGWLTTVGTSDQAVAISEYAPIQNEPSLSNTRGTLAMQRNSSDDPNSATSRWFINVSDNSANFDTNNGGYTVFGRVLGDGMTVVDSIAALPLFLIRGQTNFPGVEFYELPLINGTDTVKIAMAVGADPEPSAPNYFDAASGLLRVTVDAGESGFASLAFSVASTEPSVVVKLDLSSVEVLAETVDKIATFDAATGRLMLPELVVEGVAAFRNLSFVLSDAEQLLFTLESFEQI